MEIHAQWPLFVIDATGAAHSVGVLKALAGHDYWFDGATRALDQHTSGLPFFLQDLWPQGFIGRTLPRRFPELGLPARIGDWNETHVLTYLTRRSEDSVGNLILGEESLTRYFQQPRNETTTVDVADRSSRYPQLAEAAIAGAPAGSSAGGEQPKFTAVLRDGGSLHHVLVKFSPAGSDRSLSPTATRGDSQRQCQRWRDLLVAEHLATAALRSLSLAAAKTDLIVAGERVFLESHRFDRFRERGRVGIVSLAAVADQFIGHRNGWIAAARDLASLGRISRRDASAIERAAMFGRLIGNSDMHFGNLSFFFSPGRGLTLAPLYDMLPMEYAPHREGAFWQLRTSHPSSITPCRETRPEPTEGVKAAARAYWCAVTNHPLVSDDFRSIASGQLDRLCGVDGPDAHRSGAGSVGAEGTSTHA
jgi:hypothetical protein